MIESGLTYVIVRPGMLTDDQGTGLVTAASSVERGEVPREDVAAVLAGCLRTETVADKVFEVVGGGPRSPTPSPTCSDVAGGRQALIASWLRCPSSRSPSAPASGSGSSGSGVAPCRERSCRCSAPRRSASSAMR